GMRYWSGKSWHSFENRSRQTTIRAMKRDFVLATAFVTLTLSFAMSAQDQSSSPASADFDVIIKRGTFYDGSGDEPRQADVAIRGDRIAGIGDFKSATAKTIVDAKGFVVAP